MSPGGHGPLYSTTGQGVGGDGGDGVVAAKDLNLAESFAQATTQATSQSAGHSASKFADHLAGQSAGQFAGQGGGSASDEPIVLPARHPDSAMPESWLDVLNALKYRAKTAHDYPDQREAPTDAAFAELTRMNDDGSCTTGGAIYAEIAAG